MSHVPVYSFCHAQSTDPNDFMAPMAYWAREMEHAWASYQRGVVCSSNQMRDQWLTGGLPHGKLHWCGHTFNASTVRRLFRLQTPNGSNARKQQVVYSARWDKEKNPWFFIELAKQFAVERPEVRFVICTSLPKLTSNSAELLQLISDYPYGNLEVRTGLSKWQYFQLLYESQVQFNCASQDFVSYTLLDAAMMGCAPLYPARLTFPDALNGSHKNLYYGDFDSPAALGDAAVKLSSLLDSEWESYDWLLKKYEGSTRRKLKVMGFDVGHVWPIDVLCKLSVPELKDKLCID